VHFSEMMIDPVDAFLVVHDIATVVV